MRSRTPRSRSWRELVVVGLAAIDRRFVEFEVARVDDEPGGSGDPETDGVGDAVADAEGFDGEGTGFEDGVVVGVELDQFGSGPGDRLLRA